MVVCRSTFPLVPDCEAMIKDAKDRLDLDESTCQ